MAAPMTKSSSVVPPAGDDPFSLPGPTPSGSMSYLDPPTVLQKLDPALNGSGSIMNPQEVPRVIDFMKESDLMVNRCIILNVIKATDAPNTLSKFMDIGGWSMLNVWLTEAKKAQNTPLLTEILHVLQKLPVGMESLKQGNMGKLIKQLTKQETGDVQSLAGEILTKWMTMFREAKAKSSEERKNSVNDESSTSSAKATPTKKKSSSKKTKGKGDGGQGPESMQPPPGPLVALGRPKDKTHKRPRDLLVGQPPAEKKTKASPAQEGKSADGKPGKVFVESEGFMNALSTQAAKLKEKKIKKASKISKPVRTTSTSEPVPETKPAPPTVTTEEGVAATAEAMETDGPQKKVKKKKVTWASDDNLTRVQYFELDESERENVNRRTSFMDAAQQEKMREREALESGLMFSRDRLIEMIPWTRPCLLEVLGDLVVRGGDSKERELQAEREGKVLAQLFLSKASVQPSPVEPDPETDLVEAEPKLIPLLEPSTAGGAQSQAHMFASPPPLALSGSGPVHPGSPLPSPATTINQAQSLINYFNEHGTNPGGRGRGGMSSNNGGPGSSPYQGSDGNYYPQSQGFPPPQQGDPPIGPPGAAQWRPMEGGGYYGGEGHFRGQGDPMRRGRGFSGPPRGRGRGFMPPWRRGLESKICKHFLTHGCKLGSKCRFMHCSPEELANKMATSEHGARPPSRGGRGGRYEGPALSRSRNGDNSLPPTDNASSPPIHQGQSTKYEPKELVATGNSPDRETDT